MATGAPTRSSSPSSRDGGFLALKSRVVYSLLRAAARVALRLRFPLDRLLQLTRMAYVEEARERQGLELESIAVLFGKSLRTVSSLHSQYRGDFFAPERQVQLRREVAALCNAQPRRLDELAGAFPDRDPHELDVAAADLLREGRIAFDGTRYRRNPEDHDFFDGNDLARQIDGLNRQMDILADTVWARLLDRPSDAGATARTYVFAADEARYRQLLRELLDKLRADAIAADAAAGDRGASRTRGITLASCTLEDDLG